MALCGLVCHSVALVALSGASVCQWRFMPLGGILSRRYGGVLTIGTPGDCWCHSKRLECRGDTGTPGSAKGGLGWRWWLVAGIPPILGGCAAQWWECPTLDAGRGADSGVWGVRGARCGVQMGRMHFDT